MKSTFEQMGGTYRQEGDYLLPNLTLPDEPEHQIGKYGLLRRGYLKNHRSGIYTAMFLDGTLYQHLAAIDQTCSESMELIVRQMAEREGVTEALKATAQLEWVGRMNNIKLVNGQQTEESGSKEEPDEEDDDDEIINTRAYMNASIARFLNEFRQYAEHFPRRLAGFFEDIDACGSLLTDAERQTLHRQAASMMELLSSLSDRMQEAKES